MGVLVYRCRMQSALREMAEIGARMPLVNMGTRMLGPTLLEYGTEEQKVKHLNIIAQGKLPGARVTASLG